MDLVKVFQNQIFTQENLNGILPVILRLTTTAKARYEYYESQLLSLNRGGKNTTILAESEIQLEAVLARWQKKIIALGGSPKGLWMADFDGGDGYFCWKFPESVIGFWHRYEDGFTHRVRIDSTYAHRSRSDQSDTWSI